MTHDYKRNGTTTLFAALSMLDGKVIGQCLPGHRHQEFLKFLRTLDRESPPDRALVQRHYTRSRGSGTPRCRGSNPLAWSTRPWASRTETRAPLVGDSAGTPQSGAKHTA
jgi:hypothetical protein